LAPLAATVSSLPSGTTAVVFAGFFDRFAAFPRGRGLTIGTSSRSSYSRSGTVRGDSERRLPRSSSFSSSVKPGPEVHISTRPPGDIE